MFFTFAFFSGTQMLVMGFLGLLIFGKDLPTIARNAARQYYIYKRKFSEATADLRREMDNAASVIEEEKRKLEREIKESMPTLDEHAEPTAASADPLTATDADPNLNGTPDEPATPPASAIPAPPQKPSADPLSLDVPAPGTLAHRVTEPAKSTVAKAKELDQLKTVPPPTKIPPALG
jgi:Sec-independent protein translocase protein TatA